MQWFLTFLWCLYSRMSSYSTEGPAEYISCHCAAVGYAAQSLLAALGSVQFLTNVAFASLVLNEKVR